MFDKITHIVEDKYELSLGKILLAFYILCASSQLFPLLSKQLKTKLEEDRIAQHVLGIMTLLAVVILFSNGKFSTTRILVYTAISYMLFILSTKMDLHLVLITFGLIIAYCLYQNTKKKENDIIEIDLTLDEISKHKLQKYNNRNYVYGFFGIILAIFAGTMIYTNKKEAQYGGGYSLINYLLY